LKNLLTTGKELRLLSTLSEIHFMCADEKKPFWLSAGYELCGCITFAGYENRRGSILDAGSALRKYSLP
jgi:hypothetical protein